MGASIPRRGGTRGDAAGRMMPSEAASPEAPPDHPEGRKQRDVMQRAAFRRDRRRGAKPTGRDERGEGVGRGAPAPAPPVSSTARPPRAGTRRVAPGGSGRE